MYVNGAVRRFIVLRANLRQIVDGQASTMKVLGQLSDFLMQMASGLRFNAHVVARIWGTFSWVKDLPRKILGIV